MSESGCLLPYCFFLNNICYKFKLVAAKFAMCTVLIILLMDSEIISRSA